MIKKCSKCREEKSSRDFSRDKNTPDGRRYVCKTCDYKRHKAYKEANREKFLLSQRRAHLKHKYSITPEDYDKILEGQGGSCKICRADNNLPRKYFTVDHCHETLKVRGLLCHRCNRALGIWKDDVSLLQSAIKYLSGYI